MNDPATGPTTARPKPDLPRQEQSPPRSTAMDPVPRPALLDRAVTKGAVVTDYFLVTGEITNTTGGTPVP
ncbi:hypothetical protein ACFVGY_15645 [Streptomyces sp. NPDC127106]|uniref:hypothetical protein n=1 Tax=Streptomyces sp. NPDC127106 TaxID=3345360 RepID=UPI00362EEFB3